MEAEVPPVSAVPKPALFDGVSDEDLLGYGVPAAWLDDVRRATEGTLFDLAEHLPGEASEALLELATGGTPQRPVHAAADADPFAHPDAQRRFRVMTNAEELQRALDYPWENWTVFLHPAQRDIVERRDSGPARVSGSAGTGKTIVALHRAVHLARTYGQAKVLLATFSDTLARALRLKLERLLGSEPGVQGRITVSAIDRVGIQVYEAAFGEGRLRGPGSNIVAHMPPCLTACICYAGIPLRIVQRGHNQSRGNATCFGAGHPGLSHTAASGSPRRFDNRDLGVRRTGRCYTASDTGG